MVGTTGYGPSLALIAVAQTKFLPVRRNLDFYAEISEATVKNDNKQQKKNSYGKGKDSKNKVNPD